jgi:hypothetical protein
MPPCPGFEGLCEFASDLICIGDYQMESCALILHSPGCYSVKEVSVIAATDGVSTMKGVCWKEAFVMS